ncbi:MAG: 6-phosphogluconolactonase [Ignavibacteria bacterium]|nr:6-phosphogluconolactonase [Ignavibacteria bacterium]
MSCKIDISKSVEELSEKVAKLLQSGADAAEDYFTVALSGGSTPKAIFKYLAANYKDKIVWNKIKFFWGDERCVPADHPDSNFLMTNENLFDKIEIPAENIFMIDGENIPADEAVRYSSIIKENVVLKDSFPKFDLILLGLGEDGHTASIFPNRIELLNSKNICEVAQHPILNQKRITITGEVINSADQIIFLVTGDSKAKMIDTVINKKNDFEKLPASFVKPKHGKLIWMLDEAAANLIAA